MQKYLFFILALGLNLLLKAQNSPLATGDWVRMDFEEQGVYVLTFEKLQEMGFDVNAVEPSQIHIYGLQGGMLPQHNNAPVPTTITEIPLKLEIQEQDRFTSGDRILFYVDALDALSWDSQESIFSVEKNLYADKVSYFVTINGNTNKKISSSPDLGSSNNRFDWHHQIIHHELELSNLLNSGRSWLGERLTNNELSFTHSISANENKLARFKVKAVAQSFGSSSLNINLNNESFDLSFAAIPNQQYTIKGDEKALLGSFTPSERLNLNISYERNGSTNATAYLDSYLLQIPTNNTFSEDFLLVNAAAQKHDIAEFVIETNQSLGVWEISNPLEPVEQLFRESNGDIRFSTFTDELTKFWVFDPNELPEPLLFERISNQDLLGSSTPELIIITHEDFYDQAMVMAQFRESHSQMDVLVATIDQVYNEFSSGRPDLTAIRNFIRTKYQQSPRLNYVLLFGKGSYDYLGHDQPESNFVPTYESRNSLHPLFSFSSDDYFGFLDENEGQWIENRAGDHDLEVGIGRIPVTTVQEAQDFVFKWKDYQTNSENYGDWRTKVTFVADDGDRNIHQRDADILARTVESNHKEFEVNKLYLDAFEQLNLPNGQSSPQAEQALLDAVHEGRLLINFTGHGAEFGWTQERILTFARMEEWNNPTRLPFLVTATCEFGRNDDPEIISGAEYLLTKKNSGAIGLVTTARPVFSSTNFKLNEALYEVMLTIENGAPLHLGDIIRYTKNNSLEGSINRNFILLGDPSMQLAMPKERVTIESINEQSVTGRDTVRAFEEVTFTGRISNTTDFNGTILFELIDKPSEKTTFGTESDPFLFTVKDQIISRGSATVSNGAFVISTRIPRNINYRFGKGRLQLYAMDEEGNKDAFGSFEEFVLGGSGETLSDTNAPTGRLFLNDTSAMVQNNYPTRVRLIALLEDESGINISSNGLGQDILLTLNDSVNYLLNDQYRNLPDQYEKGILDYMITGLPVGLNHLRLEFWDNQGNRSIEEMSFLVGENSSLINEIKNYPNPFKNETQFSINHQLSGDQLEVKIELITANGRKVGQKTLLMNNADSEMVIPWDIAADLGRQLEKGVYIYDIQISSRSSGLKDSRRQKLIISY